VREIRDKLAPNTLIVGNGDVMFRKQGKELAKKYKLDGIMIGRGALTDPYVFAISSQWSAFSPSQKLKLYKKHIQLFVSTWQNNERNFHALKKFAKVYLSGFNGANNIRSEFVRQQSIKQMLAVLDKNT
jgi:tRNA-dihydrouridine synthase